MSLITRNGHTLINSVIEFKNNFFSNEEGSWEIYQNYMSLFVVFFSLGQLIFGTDLNLSHHIIGCHLIIDSFITRKPDLLMHHFFILVLYFYDLFNRVPLDVETTLFAPLIKTEISTIFYTIECIIKHYKIRMNKTNLAIINIAFFSTFMYYRIYGLFYNLFISEEYWNALVITRPAKDFWFYLMYVNYFGFYVLNLHWAAIIFKKIFKSIFGKTEEEFVSNKRYMDASNILKYTGFTNIITACIIYSYNYSSPIVNYKDYDLYGLVFLSVFNYCYHNNCAEMLKRKEVIDYAKYPANFIFLLDNFAIRFRTVMFIVAYVYLRPELMIYLYVTILNHAVCFFYTIKILLNNTIPILYTDNDSNEKNLIYIFIGLPIFCDIVFVGWFSNGYFGHMIVIGILIYLNNVIKPTYEYTHLLFHFFLFLQVITLCTINQTFVQHLDSKCSESGIYSPVCFPK